MANHKSSVKRAKQTIKKTLQNKMKESRVKSAVKNLNAAIEAKEKSKALDLFKTTQSLITRLAQQGIITKGSAQRKTSRLMGHINKI